MINLTPNAPVTQTEFLAFRDQRWKMYDLKGDPWAAFAAEKEYAGLHNLSMAEYYKKYFYVVGLIEMEAQREAREAEATKKAAKKG